VGLGRHPWRGPCSGRGVAGRGWPRCVGWCRRFDPGGSLDRRVKLSLRAPAQMGWREMEHKGGGGNRGSCYPAPEWVRLQ
jgi:hypothetical protein